MVKLVITIDGGGTRGILAASVVRELFSCLNISATDVDLLAGTSTGSIIATLLAAGWSIDEIIEWYKEKSKDIFKKRHWLPLFEEKYDASVFESILKRYLDFDGSKLKTKVLIPLTNLTLKTLDVYKSWRNDTILSHEKLCDIIRAATAAPIYFEPKQLGLCCYADGGLICNNPAMCAYVEAIQLWSQYPILLISIGCGRKLDSISCKEAADWGAINWINKLVDIFVNASYEHELLKRISKQNHLLYYFRLNPDLPADLNVRLDETDVNILTRFEEYGKKSISTYVLDAIASIYTSFVKLEQY